MITKMKHYTFLVFHAGYEAFLSRLQEAGVVHISCREANADDSKVAELLALSDKTRRYIKEAEEWLAPNMTADESTELGSEALFSEMDQLRDETHRLRQAIASAQREAERMRVLGDFSSARLADLRKEGYDLHIFTCPKARFQEEWGVVVAEESGIVYFAALACPEEGINEFVLAEHSTTELERDVQNLNALLVAQTSRCSVWAKKNISLFKNYLRTTLNQVSWKRVKNSTADIADGAVRWLEGYCPDEAVAGLEAVLANETDIYYESEDARKDDTQVPIQLRNNWFTRLFECLTGMYGMPAYSEFDPTPILGPFFLLFFSLCIGDAGYGLLLILVGYLIHKEKLKIDMFMGMGPIIMALGVGSTVIGYMMGGFFGVDIFAAEWFPAAGKAVMFKGMFGEQLMGYDIMMVLALVIGIIHICLAMTVKCICFTKRFGFKETISSWGWLILILGSLIALIIGSIVGWGAQVTEYVLIGIGAVSALGIFIFNKPGRNPLLNIGAGLWDTYQMATGVLGDVLSYIRLYALGLAGGMLGMAFNQLGTMVLGDTPNIGTWIGFILIVTFGHVLNLLMACLGAFVHPLRLSFVEYFKNAGYEGSGKTYSPFSK